MKARPRLSPILPLALLALLAAPAAAASSDGAVAQLSTSRLASPAAAVSGALAAFEDLDGVGSFTFDAGTLDVVVEEERGTIYAEQTPPSAYEQQPPVHRTHEGVQGARIDLREDHSAYVLPLQGQPTPTIVPDPGCAALAPSTREQVQPRQIYNPEARARHPERADTRTAVAWDAQACPAPAWTVTGSFLVTLFEADVTVGGTTYASGESEEGTGTVPVVPFSFNATEERTYRYVYLTVRDGWLRASGDPAVFLASAEVRTAALVLEDAHGTIPAVGEAPLAGARVELAGDLVARAGRAGAGAALDVRVTGRLDSGTVAGQSVAVASGGGPGADLWLAGLLAVPVLAGGGAAAWRGGPARRLARLDRLGMAGAPGAAAVAARSRRLERYDDIAREAMALRIEALARGGRGDDALAEAERLGGWEGALAAAYVHALLGEPARAVEALRPWRAANAAALGLALRQPVFAAVRLHPEAARWAQGAGP